MMGISNTNVLISILLGGRLVKSIMCTRVSSPTHAVDVNGSDLDVKKGAGADVATYREIWRQQEEMLS